jgi:hypothetical protein
MSSNIEDLVKSGSNIIEVGKAAHIAVAPTNIRMDRDCYDTVMENKEISLAVEKRFKGKRTLHENPGYKQLIAWCLSTDSYKLSEKNIEKVSNADIELAWQFIDTASVSSTKDCRDMISKYRGTRSGVGFRRQHTKSRSDRINRVRFSREAVSSTLLPHTEADSAGYDTLSEMLAEDCMHWIKQSPDPVGATLSLRSRLLKRYEGSSNPV